MKTHCGRRSGTVLRWWCQLGALILTSCQSLNRWGSKHGSSVRTAGFAYINSFQELFEADEPIDFYNILGFSFFKEKLEAGWKRYEHAEDLTLVSSAEHNFELSSRKASKGQALKRLAKQLNIPLEETAAVGDSLNDKSMLEAAGKGVAMGNAREDIKSIADAVTLTNDEHGVAHMMKHLL